MSNYDEEDDFFDDIYGDDDKKQSKDVKEEPTDAAAPAAAAPAAASASTEPTSANPAPTSAATDSPAPAAAAAAPAAAPVAPAAPVAAAPASAPADPRLAFLAGGAASGAAPSAPAAAPTAAPAAPAAPAAAPAPASIPGMPSFPGAPGASGIPGFDPSALSQQLQQLQQLAGNGGNSAAAAAVAAAAAAGMGPSSDLKPAEQGGFLAGKIFIPAKDEGKMFIGGLNWETTDESMRNYFSQFGEVTECTVMRDNASGRSRGFGFLTFRDPKVVSVVLSKEHFLDGKIIDPKRAIPREEQDKTAKIFVGGVGADVTEGDFKSFFEQYGTVIDAQLMMDKDTGRPRGFGFVTFDSDNAVERIVAEQFLVLKGKPIEVKRAEPRGRDDNRNGRSGHAAAQQQNMYGYGMDPAMMSQYYQQVQTYMARMQEMMQGQGGANPMMQMYGQMMQGQAGTPPAGGAGGPPNAQGPTIGEMDDERARHNRYDRRGNDDRRRSRSPGSSQGGRPQRRRLNPHHDRNRERDRHYNRASYNRD